MEQATKLDFLTHVDKIPLADNHNDWLLQRQAGLGGSDVGAILGLNRYRSPIDIYYSKTSSMLAMDSAMSEAAYWGTVLEDPIRNAYAEKNSDKVAEIFKPDCIFADQQLPFMRANLDGIVITKDGSFYGYEGKTANEHTMAEWEDDGVPISYVLQVQHYMAILGIEYFDIACLVGGQKYIQRRVVRDEDIIRILREKEEEFWQRVIDRDPPAWTGTESEAEILSKLFPTSMEGKIIKLDDSMVPTFREYKALAEEISEQRKALSQKEKEAQALKQALQFAIGDAEIAEIDGCLINTKQVKRKSYMVNETSWRQFKIIKPKNQE